MYVCIYVRMHVRMYAYTYNNLTIAAVDACLCAFVCVGVYACGMLVDIVLNRLSRYSLKIIPSAMVL